jgi:hypothetical protein
MEQVPRVGLAEQSDWHDLAPLDRLASQIPPVDFEQIERAQEYVPICSAAPRLALSFWHLL